MFFSESQPVPETVYAQFRDGVSMGDNIPKRVVQSGIVRELEVDVVLSLEEAYKLKEMLEQNIKLVEGLVQAHQNKHPKKS